MRRIRSRRRAIQMHHIHIIILHLVHRGINIRRSHVHVHDRVHVLLGLSWVHHRVDIRDLIHVRVDVAAGAHIRVDVGTGHHVKVRV